LNVRRHRQGYALESLHGHLPDIHITVHPSTGDLSIVGQREFRQLAAHAGPVEGRPSCVSDALRGEAGLLSEDVEIAWVARREVDPTLRDALVGATEELLARQHGVDVGVVVVAIVPTRHAIHEGRRVSIFGEAVVVLRVRGGAGVLDIEEGTRDTRATLGKRDGRLRDLRPVVHPVRRGRAAGVSASTVGARVRVRTTTQALRVATSDDANVWFEDLGGLEE